MAQKVSVILTDDLDGGQADETVSFALDGKAYEIDLSATNAETLRSALGPFIAAARRDSGAGAKAASRGRSSNRPARTDLAEVREWARANGHQVSDRGRVSSEVLAAYDARNLVSA